MLSDLMVSVGEKWKVVHLDLGNQSIVLARFMLGAGTGGVKVNFFVGAGGSRPLRNRRKKVCTYVKTHFQSGFSNISMSSTSKSGQISAYCSAVLNAKSKLYFLFFGSNFSKSNASG